MKALRFISFLFLLFVVFALPLAAQTTTDNIKVVQRENGVVFRWDTITVDSADAIWSQMVDVSLYDNDSFASYPVAFSYRPVKTVANDSINASLEYWTCNGDPTVTANWKVADTLYTTATLKATATPAVTNGTHDLNNVKAAYAKFKYRNNGTGSKAHTMNTSVYFYRRD